MSKSTWKKADYRERYREKGRTTWEEFSNLSIPNKRGKTDQPEKKLGEAKKEGEEENRSVDRRTPHRQ